jgi:hypothetical protein
VKYKHEKFAGLIKTPQRWGGIGLLAMGLSILGLG